ncbi:MAG: hypothetical protein WC140_00370 [Bacteroidales bacterium]
MRSKLSFILIVNSLFIISCIFPFQNILAQNISVVKSEKTIFSGQIIDINDSLVIGANVVLRDKNQKIIVLGSSDKNGEFALNYKNKEIAFVEFLHLNYQKKKMRISEFHSPVRMSFRENTLSSVVISAHKFSINKDTNTFYVQAYTDSTETNIEEVIKKLPGMKVDKQGKISFNGKRISKLLLDGADMFGGDYSVASRTIKPEMIAKIQTIDDYHENKLLKGLVKSDEMAINLSMDKSKKGVMGKLQGSLGVPKVYGGMSNMFYISPMFKVQSISSVDNNNTKANTYSFSNKMRLYDISKEYTSWADSRLIYSAYSQSTSNNVFDKYKERRQVEILNTYSKPNDMVEISSNFTFSKSKFESDYSNFTNYYNNDVKTSYDRSNNLKPTTIGGNIKLIYNINDKLRLEINSLADSFNGTNLESIDDNIKHSLTNTDISDKYLFINNECNLSYLINKNTYSSFDMKYLYNDNSQLFYYNNTESDDIILNQKVRAFTRSLQLRSSMVHNFNSYFDIGMGFQYENRAENMNIINNSLFSDTKLTNNIANIYINPIFHIGISDISLNIKAGPTWMNNYSKNEDRKCYFSSLLKYQLLKSYNKFIASLSYEKSALPSEAFLANSYYTSFRTHKRQMAEIDQYVSSYLATISYFYSDLFDGFNMNSLYSVNYQEGLALSLLDVSSDITEIRYTYDNNVLTQLVNLSLEKYIDPLFSTLKFSTNLFHNRYYSGISTTENRLNSVLSMNYRLKYSTAFRLPINFILKASYNTSKISGSAYTDVKNSYFNFTQKLFFRLNSLSIKISSDEYYNNSSNADNGFLTNLNARASYSFLKNQLIFGIDAYNLLNINHIDAIFQNEYHIINNIYYLPRRQLLFSLSYSF